MFNRIFARFTDRTFLRLGLFQWQLNGLFHHFLVFLVWLFSMINNHRSTVNNVFQSFWVEKFKAVLVNSVCLPRCIVKGLNLCSVSRILNVFTFTLPRKLVNRGTRFHCFRHSFCITSASIKAAKWPFYGWSRSWLLSCFKIIGVEGISVIHSFNFCDTFLQLS